MTTTADSRKRVILPAAKPGDRFDVQVSADGVFVLRRLEPMKGSGRPAKVRFEKRGRFTAAISDRPINEEAIKELLANFP
jgi:hypothetical protein